MHKDSEICDQYIQDQRCAEQSCLISLLSGNEDTCTLEGSLMTNCDIEGC